jgi:hypothetical protein
MNPEISIIMPAIRPHNWERVVNSIVTSTRRPWELIIVSPYSLPVCLQNFSHIKHVKDFGSPMRASQIGSLLVESPVMFFLMADDAVFLPDALDKTFHEFMTMPPDVKNVVINKYTEGIDGTEKSLQDDNYYKVNGADCTRSPFIPDDFWIFNTGLMYYTFFRELGGWDCKFEACPMGLTDLAVRAQFEGAKVKMCQTQILDVGHMPGTSGDHAPIHYAQILHDQPMFQAKWGNETSVNQHKHKSLSLSNWRQAPRVWNKRFGGV